MWEHTAARAALDHAEVTPSCTCAQYQWALRRIAAGTHPTGPLLTAWLHKTAVEALTPTDDWTTSS